MFRKARQHIYKDHVHTADIKKSIFNEQTDVDALYASIRRMDYFKISSGDTVIIRVYDMKRTIGLKRINRQPTHYMCVVWNIRGKLLSMYPCDSPEGKFLLNKI